MVTGRIFGALRPPSPNTTATPNEAAENALNERDETGIRRSRPKLVTNDGLDVASYKRRCCRGSPGWSEGAEQAAGR